MGAADLSYRGEGAMRSGDSLAATEKRCPVCGGPDFARMANGLMKCQQCSIVLSPSIWLAGANEAFEDEWFGDDHQRSRPCGSVGSKP